MNTNKTVLRIYFIFFSLAVSVGIFGIYLGIGLDILAPILFSYVFFVFTLYTIFLQRDQELKRKETELKIQKRLINLEETINYTIIYIITSSKEKKIIALKQVLTKSQMDQIETLIEAFLRNNVKG